MESKESRTVIYMNDSSQYESLIVSDIPIEVYDPFENPRANEEFRTGTILRNTIEMLELLLEDPGNRKLIISETDNATGKMLKNFLNFEVIYSSKMGLECEIPHMKSFIDYIKVCSKNRSLCTINDLQQFHVMINEPFNRCHSKLMNIYGYSDESLNESKIAECLLGETMNERLIRKIEEDIPNMKPEIAYMMKQTEKILYKNRKKGGRICVNYYKIGNVIDLISACLQEIFNINKCVAICDYCGRLYIPQRRRDTKYCSYTDYHTGRTCREQVQLNKQILRDNANDGNKMQKSIRTMLAVKYGSSSEELRNFLDNNFNRRNLVKSGSISQQEYEEWLKTFYKRKYK